MHYFALLDFQYAVLALFLGLLGVVLATVAWAGYRRREEGDGPGQPAGAVPEAEHNPVPPVLYFVYAAVAAGAVGYAVAVAVQGRPVGF